MDGVESLFEEGVGVLFMSFLVIVRVHVCVYVCVRVDIVAGIAGF